jgi:hypothetical protein
VVDFQREHHKPSYHSVTPMFNGAAERHRFGCAGSRQIANTWLIEVGQSKPGIAYG